MARDDEQDDQDPLIPDDHVKDIAYEPLLSHDAQMLSQILGGIQELQQGLNTLNINVSQQRF